MEKDPALRLRVFDLNCWWVQSPMRLWVWGHLPHEGYLHAPFVVGSHGFRSPNRGKALSWASSHTLSVPLFSHVEKALHVLPNWGCAASPCRWGKPSSKSLPAHPYRPHHLTIPSPPQLSCILPHMLSPYFGSPRALIPSPPLRLRAIRYLSKRRQERIHLIGDQLCREGFDLVLLQEIWSERDYSDLKAKLSGCCPFSHYFRSGVIGSGLCVFSKFPILDTLLYQYSLNGYPYMLQHGDWFCGKSVGLVIVRIAEITFNIYVTHLHAEYSREKDAYLPHRVVQAWELAQFICHTAKAADVVLLGGDLNMHPGDVGIRLLRGWTGLQDAFTEAKHFEGCEDGCTLIPNNCFTVKSELQPFPLGIRIDYILYKAVSSFTVKCEELRTTTGTVPGMDIPYSDHEAVMAVLCIQRRGQTAGVTTGPAMPALVEVLSEARTEVCMGLLAARRQRYSSGRMAVLAMLLLLVQAVGVLGVLGGLAGGKPFPALSFSLLAFLALAILLLAAGLHLFHSIEVKMLQSTKEQMEMAMWGLQERPLHRH